MNSSKVSGGGVLAYIKASIPHICRENLKIDSMEMVAVEVKPAK